MLVRLALLVLAGVLGATALPVGDVGNTRLFEVDGKYIFNSVPANWTEALKHCEMLGGRLAVISSQTELQALVDLMARNSVAAAVHVGFHDKFIEHEYVTNDDERIPTNSTYWKPGSPGRGSVARNCGGLTPTGIADIDCSVEQTSICEIRTWDEYDSFSATSRYNFHAEKRTWADAWNVCAVEGGHLLVPDSLEEAAAIYRKYPIEMWLGVHRVHGDDLFLTVTNRRLEWSGFSQWADYFPFGDSKSYPYVALGSFSSQSTNPSLFSATSTNQLAFVCQSDRAAVSIE